MKRKIAVFVNGWTNEYLRELMEGMQEAATENQTDLFVFMNYSSWSDGPAQNLAEQNIFRLPKPEMFDGVIMASNTIFMEEEKELLRKQILAKKVPAITLETEQEGLRFMGSDNYSGMYDLVKHLICEHQAKNILVVGGTTDHVESVERITAARDAAKDCGVVIDENHIVYGQWYHVEAAKVTGEWIKRNNGLPDAVVCVNDQMALGIYRLMERYGYRIPEDVIVTGFDDISTGRNIFPSLTSAGKETKETGRKALETILRMVEGMEVPERTVFHSKLRIGESCGCTMKDCYVAERKMIARKVYADNTKKIMTDGHYRQIQKLSRHVIDMEMLRRTYQKYFAVDRIFHSDTCCLVVNQDYFRAEDKNYKRLEFGYGPKLDVLCALTNGEISKEVEINTDDLIPDYNPESEKPHMYVFVSLHMETHSVGYVMISDDLEVFDSFEIYTWSRNMTQNLDQVRQNIHLENLNRTLKKLSLTDALTGLYNRMGCDELVQPFLEDNQECGKKSMLMITDINKMKLINDQYGHLQGDVAIKTVAEVLRSLFEEDGYAVRFGGDEFLSVIQCDTVQQAEEIEKELLARLQTLIEKMQLSFPLKVSNGYTLIERYEEISLDKFIRRADMAMYSDKRGENSQS